MSVCFSIVLLKQEKGAVQDLSASLSLSLPPHPSQPTNDRRDQINVQKAKSPSPSLPPSLPPLPTYQ
jgi:hypothetical protein